MLKFAIIFICCVLGISFAIFFYFGSEDENGLTDAVGSDLIEQSSERNVPAGHIEYNNEQFGFSLIIPDELIVNEFDEGGGAQTITFETENREHGFQIFIVPYYEEVITNERIAIDIPSGIVRDQVEIMIGGVRASAFHSEHPFMGETREVWFIHNNHLYEIVTYKRLDSWLAAILNTWDFPT